MSKESKEYTPLLKTKGSLVDDDEEEGGSVRDRSGPHCSTYEEAITQTGYGCFHYKLLLLCGWAVSSDAVEILGVSFILPPATPELGLSDADKGWINSSVFLGMMVGGYLWGTLADMQGRRQVLLWSLTVNALGGLGSSLAQSYWLFVTLRFVSGIGVGGSMPVIFTYFTEFQPKDRRGSMISVLATFWMGGNILAAALAWIIIPLDFSTTSASGFHYNSWRTYLALCTLPSLTSAALFVLMPESPKFLMQKGDEIGALSVLRRIHRSNHKKNPHAVYPVEAVKVAYGELDLRSLPWATRLKIQVLGILSATVRLYRAPLTSVSIVMTIIYFTLSFGYYGLFMWFPELFSRIEIYGGSACSPRIPVNGSAEIPVTVPPNLANTIYFESFLTALSNLPGNILTILIIDRVGRKILLSSSMVLSGISVFFIYLLDSKTQSLIMSCVFGAISVIGWNSLDVLQAELFPTNMRSTASGTLMSVGRIAAVLGNTVFGQLVDSNCAVPMVMVAVLLSVGGLSAIGLPNMTRRDLL